MSGHAPDALKALQTFSGAATQEGALSTKTKELIALAVSVKAQCPYCIDIHTSNARRAGATDPEITEAVVVAAAIGAGAVMTHGTHALLTGANGS
ncbi:alkylhydroperoxidase [Spiribacter halobius]|uniref:Alkylhydroperoxidase n=2 Tax=Sediminicurvatus halobius TaxID=2182432 RepID=A0A2U2N3L3_9GAMM|nr:alkylhydroperoxidase [Spiribacter halobius]